MIRHRVVPRFDRRDRSDAPAREHVRPEERFGDAPCPVGGSNPAEEAMTGIGGAHLARALVPIQRERVGRLGLAPEVRFERRTKPLGLASQLLRARSVCQSVRHAGRRQTRFVDIGLHFTQGDWRLRQRSIRVKDRVVRVLPTLLDQPGR